MNILMGMRTVYTKEVLSSVIQHLIEMDPLPALLMRTVLHAYNLHPQLLGFVINVLNRLVMKQVSLKQKYLYELLDKTTSRKTGQEV